MAKPIQTKPTVQTKVLKPYQREIVACDWYDPVTGQARTHTLEKARRVGGSTAGAYWAVFVALGREPQNDGDRFIQREPTDVYIVSKDYLGAKNLLREVVDACVSMAPLDPDFEVVPTATTVTFKSTGKRIVALPCRSETIRSHGGACVLDEVAFWRTPEEIWGAVKVVAGANLKVGKSGSPILAITTPWDAGSLAHRIFTDTSFPFVRHRVDIYRAADEGFPIDIEQTKLELGIPELFASEFELSWSFGGASFFPLDKLRDCQEDELPADWDRYPAFFGEDIGGGKGRDFTAIVQWRLIDGVAWMVGLKASNQWQIDERVEVTVDWLRDALPHTKVVASFDRGIMGGDTIDMVKKSLRAPERAKTTIRGLGMMPADQERYAKNLRRLLELDKIKLYTGTEAGGEEHGARALMLELSQLKAKPGSGGHLTFATPRDPSRGHMDRAWAAMLGAPGTHAVQQSTDDSDAGTTDTSIARILTYDSPLNF